MMKKTVIWLIVAAALAVVGAALFLIGAAVTGFDFSQLNTDSTVTNTYDFSEEIRNIKVDADVAAVVFEPAEDGRCTVICQELEKQPHTVEVIDGELRIIAPEKKGISVHIGFSWNLDLRVTAKLPAGEYEKLDLHTDTGSIKMPGDYVFAEAECSSDTGGIRWSAAVQGNLKLHTDTGAVRAENCTAAAVSAESDTGAVVLDRVVASGAIEAECDTGALRLSGVRCGSLDLDMDTGSVSLKDTVVTGLMNIRSDTGSVVFDACDAAEVKVRTGTGGVSGTFVTPKIFYAESGTGKVSVPKSDEGGLCDVHTGTGRIQLDFVK